VLYPLSYEGGSTMLLIRGIFRPVERAHPAFLVMHFRWRLGDQEVEGVDMMHFDAEGLLEEYTVMVRPLPAVLGLRDAVFSQLPGA
jgi:hypothetical protein